MGPFRKVLFPVDVSRASMATAPFVDSLVRHFRAELTLLHVMDFGAALAGWEPYVPAIDIEVVRKKWQQGFYEFLRDKFEGVNVSRVVKEGDPASEIVALAEKTRTDLIMMPTHGRGLFRSLLLGSVTAKVLHDAPCPVWTAAHMEEIPQQLAEIDNVLCAVDLKEQSIALMQFASGLASEFGATLWLVHAVPGVETMPEKYFDAHFESDLQQEARAKISRMQQQAGVSGLLCIGTGELSQVVKNAAVHHAAGVVVAGRGHATQAFGRLRTHVYSIIRQSPCPVISL